MGDRATFVFEQGDGDGVYLYGHWAGEGMMNTLAEAISKARPRWNDEGYATRIIISQIIGNEWTEETGWGITTYFCDSEHSVPVINFQTQTVRLIPKSWDTVFDISAEPKFVMGFEAFVNKFAKYLTTVQKQCKVIHITTTTKGNNMAKNLTSRTPKNEIWVRTEGQFAGKKVAKKVHRSKSGQFLGATNQTVEKLVGRVGAFS